MKLKGLFNLVVGILFFLSLISIDSDSWMPLIVCVVSWVYLAFAAWRNGLMYEREDEAE
jgi:hypothetical protein